MFVRIDNRKIHYKKFGNGKPIIFVHGWGGSMFSLHALAIEASKEYTSIILDLPGFGRSDNPPPHWGVEGYAEIVTKFIQALKLKQPLYVGHSFGGEIGIYIASHMPKIIGSLILCNSSFKRENKVSKISRILKLFPVHTNRFIKSFEPHIKKLYYKIFHRSSELFKYPHLEANFRKIITQDLTEDVKKITKPTLIIWGEEDTYTPVLWAYELAHNIKGSRLIVIPGIGHALPIKLPSEVWDHIDSFNKTK